MTVNVQAPNAGCRAAASQCVEHIKTTFSCCKRRTIAMRHWRSGKVVLMSALLTSVAHAPLTCLATHVIKGGWASALRSHSASFPGSPGVGAGRVPGGAGAGVPDHGAGGGWVPGTAHPRPQEAPVDVHADPAGERFWDSGCQGLLSHDCTVRWSCSLSLISRCAGKLCMVPVQ